MFAIVFFNFFDDITLDQRHLIDDDKQKHIFTQYMTGKLGDSNVYGNSLENIAFSSCRTLKHDWNHQNMNVMRNIH